MQIQDNKPLLHDNILLYCYSDKPKKTLEITINGKYTSEQSFKNLFFIDTGLEKGSFIRFVYVKFGYIGSHGYYFKVQECVEELILELYKDKLTLNGLEPRMLSDPTCVLS
ncbi:hypothetical protein [Cedratvirus kamchatka]|uniref:Uncharacterized protein n=1 Tax=Cedratvirus kamchatka TaxID=2716914 RepID=A0A6G8MY32_9VIRU|nr:hypothetical protein [Cedratvirus kamchatka]WIL04225.1 hypothetical protein Clen_295 [Cedratvirus lena]